MAMEMGNIKVGLKNKFEPCSGCYRIVEVAGCR
jgi:hypothetical protein